MSPYISVACVLQAKDLRQMAEARARGLVRARSNTANLAFEHRRASPRRASPAAPRRFCGTERSTR
jgi:hypothetical protein